MNVFIVYCHPELDSFNGSLKDVSINFLERQGHQVKVSNLYQEKFNPIESAENYTHRAVTDRFEPLLEQRHAYQVGTLPSDIKREIERLEWCDILIFHFPLWWHQQPAMLKGWFDRVFVAGGLYSSKMRYDRGYFKNKKTICSVTSGAPLETFTARGRAGGTIDTLLYSVNYSLYYMGFTVLPPFLCDEVQGAGFTYKPLKEFQESLQTHLQNWQRHLANIKNIEPIDFPGWHDWDELGIERSHC